jgi:hypothetical protein
MDKHPLGIQLGFCFGEVQKVIGLCRTHLVTLSRIKRCYTREVAYQRIHVFDRIFGPLVWIYTSLYQDFEVPYLCFS